MNTLQDLLSNGIELNTAKRMLSEYSKRINTMNGVYKIIDINYDFSVRGKDVTLQCAECGKIIHRTMISGRNKWSELIKNCECQKIKKRESKKDESEKILKNKNAKMIENAYSMVGSDYGDYKIVSVGRNEDKLLLGMECKICGDIISAQYQSIKDNAKKYRKCKKHYNPVKFDESYIGKKNNFLKVIGITRSPNNHRAFICECDCGNTTTVEPTFWEKGIVKSCGCFSKSLKLEHSEDLDRLRRIHNGMMQRCYNQNSTSHQNYGLRGIAICQEWHDREKFIEWALKNGYSNDLSIDRIDVNGNYEPNNCRWVDWETQANNRRPKDEWKERKKRKLKTATIRGEEKPLVEWYIIYGVTAPTVAYRMKNYGLNFEEALTMPRITPGRPRKEVQ